MSTASLRRLMAVVGALALVLAGCGQVAVGAAGSVSTVPSQSPRQDTAVPTSVAPSLPSATQRTPVMSESVRSPGRGNGRIAFMRWDLALNDQAVFTMDPDGSHERRLLPGAAEFPHWSPDGREIAVLCCGSTAALIITVASGASRTLPMPDSSHLETACPIWSVDGSRLFCEGTSDDESLNGIYTIRSSDGGDLRRLTVSLGNDDTPTDPSPDGTRLLIVRLEGDQPGLYTMGVDGTGLTRIDTGSLTDIVNGSWAPNGQQIVFAARKSAGVRRSVFVIGPDGSDLREVAIESPCGGSQNDRSSRGCLDPSWSPDGSKIVLDILLAADNQKQIYTVNPDGSHLVKVTHHGFVASGEGEQAPDWGVHPLG
jgi:hypothetical protein